MADHPCPSLELVEQWLAEVWHEGTPVAVALSDMHIATRAAEWGATLAAEPPAPAEPDTDAVLTLAAIIRRVDGSHSLGAAALAEAILAHPNAASVFQPPAPAPAADDEREERGARKPDACLLSNMTASQLARAAALLRQSAPAPVPGADTGLVYSTGPAVDLVQLQDAMGEFSRQPWDMPPQGGEVEQ